MPDNALRSPRRDSQHFHLEWIRIAHTQKGTAWTITGAQLAGYYAQGSGPVRSVTLGFLDSGQPLVFRTASVSLDISGNLSMSMNSVSLPAGRQRHIWMYVQVNMDLSSGGIWYWMDRTVQTGFPAEFVNPANGFNSGCTTWKIRYTNCYGSGAPDQVFALVGSHTP